MSLVRDIRNGGVRSFFALEKFGFVILVASGSRSQEISTLEN